jgi:hypothetical protein
MMNIFVVVDLSTASILSALAFTVFLAGAVSGRGVVIILAVGDSIPIVIRTIVANPVAVFVLIIRARLIARSITDLLAVAIARPGSLTRECRGSRECKY